MDLLREHELLRNSNCKIPLPLSGKRMGISINPVPEREGEGDEQKKDAQYRNGMTV